MEKERLIQAVSEAHAGWNDVIAALGAEGLERPGATGEWRVRDVIAHCNAWDRWQLVQLRCAFSGETPIEQELLGGIVYPPSENMQEDAMNAAFMAGTRDLPLADILRHWREVCALREGWLASATQEKLDQSIGADWASGTQRIMRLASEVPAVDRPVPVWKYLQDQLDHLQTHLQLVHAWMNNVGAGSRTHVGD